MTRLTNDIRDHIVSLAIKAAFSERLTALDAAEDALCREAYNAIYDEGERAIAQSLPKYWLRLDPCLNFNVDGFRIRLCTTDNHLPVPYGAKGAGYGGGYGCSNNHGSITGELAERVHKHARDKEDAEQAKRRAKDNLSALLARLQTVKKLAEAWPEGAPYYAKYLEEKAPPPPAIRFDDVNAALGLQAA